MSKAKTLIGVPLACLLALLLAFLLLPAFLITNDIVIFSRVIDYITLQTGNSQPN